MSPDMANRRARMQRGLATMPEPVRRDREATPPTPTYERRGLAERAGTAPVNSETASKLQRVVHSGSEKDKHQIERILLEIGYEAGDAGFTPNDVRPYLRIHGVWMVNRYLVSGMYSTFCSEGLAEAIGSTRIHDRGSGNEGTACNRYRLTAKGRRYARAFHGVADADIEAALSTSLGTPTIVPAEEELFADLDVERRPPSVSRRI